MSYFEEPAPLTDKAPKHQLAARIKDLLNFGHTQINPDTTRNCSVCLGEFPDDRTYKMHQDLCVLIHSKHMASHTFDFNTDLYNQLLANRDMFLVVS